ncbi:hypothetical protein C21_00706 [Arenibacter sp. NBRC 103722]|nr:hypothetical protein C21_00706 [Arenibacter sp. NBRC 103722]
MNGFYKYFRVAIGKGIMLIGTSTIADTLE